MMKKYKELYVFYSHSVVMSGDRYKNHGLGGSESALTYMAQELARRGKHVVVFCQTTDPGMFDGVRYERIERFLSFARIHIMDVFIAVRNIDVFGHAIKARCKALWLHDAADQPHMMQLSDQRFVRNIDCYITISEWQKRGLVQKFKIPEGKIVTSRNGVNRKFFKTCKGTRKKRLVYTSTPFRGLETLLDFFPAIRARVPDVELHVYSSMQVYGVSKEQDQEQFGYIYEKCKQPGVVLVGSLPQEKLARELMKAKLFVYPNVFSETSCIAALEAQAAGLPVIASKRGALEETVVDDVTGYLIDEYGEGDAEFCTSFIEKVVKILSDDELWQRMSTHARRRVMDSFCWTHVADEWVSFFDAIRPTLSLCMIVKNEEASLGNCLRSVAPIVDEMVIVDTGSTDGTREVAQSCGAKVYDYLWQNDFSAARNFSLSHATSDWILVLDADEVIGTRDIQKVRQLINVPDVNAYLLFQRSYLNDTTVAGWKANEDNDKEAEGYSGYFDSPLTRLFRNRQGFKFEGEIHELVEYSILRKKKTIINTNIPIHHYGKVKATKKMEEKGALYLSIGKEKIKENPQDPRSYYDQAAQYYELKNIKAAKEHYKKALACDPNFYRALCDLGSIYARESKRDKAIKCLTNAIAINPNHVSSYLNLGIVYEAEGRIDDAIAAFQKALALDQNNVNAHRNLGLIYFAQQKHQEALQSFRRMRKIDASVNITVEHAAASYHVGLSFFNNNEFGKAKKYFEEAIRILPSYAPAYNNLGIIYVNTGNSDRAEEFFKKTVELAEMNERTYSECSRAYVNLGFIYNNKGMFAKALSFLEKAFDFEGTNPEVYNHIGIAKCGLGALADSVRYFQMALHLNPKHSAARINLTRVNEILVQEHNYQATIPED